MSKPKPVPPDVHHAPGPSSKPESGYDGRILSAAESEKCLDPIQLHQLEQSFRDWSAASPRSDIRASRRRILLIFLLIRYTGAKLNEVLGLDPTQDIDCEGKRVLFGRGKGVSGRRRRTVHLSEALCRDVRAILGDGIAMDNAPGMLAVDPGFVRRKFYERAEACGLAKELGAPEVLRRSRGVELMQSNMPLPAVQMLLGHSTPNLTSAYVTFSEEEIQQVTRRFMEKEGARKTSARNAFFGKIQTIRQDAIQALVELLTLGGHRITAVITNDSVQRLGLKVGKLITAEVKAPWVLLRKGADATPCSADNTLEGIVRRITRTAVNTEYIVRLADETEVCAIVTTASSQALALAVGDPVEVFFNSFAVILLSE